MTYCVALKLNAGMVFAADSRTNAGVDQISCFKKMRSFVKPGDRAIVIMSSGNLSITQNAVNLLEQRALVAENRSLWNVDSLFEVAQLLGEALREVRKQDGVFLQQNNVDASANFILGGQIHDERMRLFLIYAEGNFIEAGDETPFFQIGETKYGKPIIDRVIRPGTPLIDAVKCLLVSFDSTMRSNLSVGLPIDLACYYASSLNLEMVQHITQDDPYFSQISHRWSEGLRGVFASLPNPDWLSDHPGPDRSPPD
jgi:putative proteasome-type protease